MKTIIVIDKRIEGAAELIFNFIVAVLKWICKAVGYFILFLLALIALFLVFKIVGVVIAFIGCVLFGRGDRSR